MKYLKLFENENYSSEISSAIQNYHKSKRELSNITNNLNGVIFDYMVDTNFIKEYDLELESPSSSEFYIQDIGFKGNGFRIIINDYSGEDGYAIDISFEDFDLYYDKHRFNL